MPVKALKMAIPRSLVLMVLLGLVIGIGTLVRADELMPPSYEYGNEIMALKSKLSLLEEGLKTKEVSLSERESKISVLEQELEALRTQKGESQDAALAQLQIESAEAKVRELEGQVQALQEESRKLREEAEAHAGAAKSHEEAANLHLNEKEKTIMALEDQRIRLQKAERGLQIAEAAMLKAKAEAEEKAKRLDEIHQGWLPPWAAMRAELLQKTAYSRWSTHADPVVKNLQKSASTNHVKYVKPHLDTIQTKVNPLIREKWQKLTEAVAPHLETVKNMGVKSREYIAPHVETVQKTVSPYAEAAKEKSKPYVDKASTFAAPHLERLNTLAGPHYRRAVTTAYNYHEGVQSYLKESLGKYEFLSHLLTKESIWFLAAAVLALPIMLIFMLFRRLFSSQPVVPSKRHRSTQSGTSSTIKNPRRSKQTDRLVEK